MADMIAELRVSLNSAQKMLLNQLLDNININDSDFSYEAFKNWVLVGMSLMQHDKVAKNKAGRNARYFCINESDLKTVIINIFHNNLYFKLL